MGNTRSISQNEEDIWWSNTVPRQQMEETANRKSASEELDEFKLELARKHEKRRQLIAAKHKEFQELRDEVSRLKIENEELKQGKQSNDKSAIEDIRQKNLELKMTIAGLQKDLQDLNSEVVTFEKEREDYKAHVVALKDVVSVSKQMLLIREAQLKELREKVKEIEISLAGKELKALSQDLRSEYEKQLQNIRNLRIFYEERQRADKKEKEEMRKLLDETKKQLLDEKDKNTELSENLERLEEENSKKYDEIKNLESTLGLTKAECKQYQAELTVINQLFSQILLGFSTGQDIDIEKLIRLLEENHHLLQDIAINEESNQVSALPKVLLDLVSEVSDKDASKESEEVPKQTPQLNSASKIVENLPKVWKVLIELLSHQSAPAAEIENENPCYNVVETPKGSHLVLSVSKTFIRLKDLILEKKFLERETGRLKHLNTHLECRLQEQEKRLEMVSSELSETWHVVGKLQKKHQLLHTQEKILRYELAQKRKLLTELKEELEYSREKWQEAREKNSTTEKQWEQLRIEFAARKSAGGDDYNSVESGYSDEKESSEDEVDVSDRSKPEGEIDVSDRLKPEDETDVSDAQKPDVSDRSKPEGETDVSDRLKPEDETDVSDAPKPDVSDRSNPEDATDVSDAPKPDVSDRSNPEGETDVSDRSKPEDETDVSDAPKPDVSDRSKPEGETDVSDRSKPEDETDVSDAPKPEGEKTIDQVLSAREERLSRLENQCSSLVRQVTDTNSRSEAISSKLDALHEVYGEGSGEGSGDN